MISIQRITPQNVQVFKAVRLRALQDSPFAFGSTYARESQFADDEWLRRAETWNGVKGAGFLAIDEKKRAVSLDHSMRRIRHKLAWCRCGRLPLTGCEGWRSAGAGGGGLGTKGGSQHHATDGDLAQSVCPIVLSGWVSPSRCSGTMA